MSALICATVLLVLSSLFVKSRCAVVPTKLRAVVVRISGTIADADDATVTVAPAPTVSAPTLRENGLPLGFPAKLTTPLAFTFGDPLSDSLTFMVAPGATVTLLLAIAPVAS